MSPWRCGLLLGALLLAGHGTALRAREAAPPVVDAPPLMPSAGKKADGWKLPADGLIEMTPEKLQELLDEIARLKGKQKLPPSKCRLLNGRVEDALVLFRAEFDFHAERADAVFALACGQARARSAQQQDGRTPMLSADADGKYLVQVDKPGDYTVTLELSLPVSQRSGGARGFELDLPRAAVTTLEMNLPAGARGVHINGKELSDTVVTLDNGRLSGPLGVADKLDLAWQGPPPAGVGPLLTVHGHVTVRVEDEWMATAADLTLHSQGGAAKAWVVVAPLGFEVKAAPADQPRVQIDRQDEPGAVRYTVHVKAAGGDDLNLTAAARTWLGDGKRKTVGPFLVPGAARQSGEVLVSAAADAGLVLQPNPDLSPRDVTDEERRADPNLTAAFEYGVAPTNLPWLAVTPGSARGSIKTQEAYALSLGRTGPENSLEWQATTTITASPLVTSGGVDLIEVRLPAACEYVPSPLSDGVKRIEPDKDDPHLLRIRLNGSSQGPVAAAFKVRYPAAPVAVPPPGPATFLLPHPAPAQHDGCAQIDVTVPDDVELLPPGAPADAEIKDAHHVVWRSPSAPDPVVLSWRPYRAEVRASSLIDLTLRGRTAEVQHQLRLHFPRTAPKQLTLRTPAALGSSLQVLSGGVLADDPGPGAEMRTLKLQGAGPDQVVTLKYAFGAAETSFAVPLAVVDQAREGDARLRVWCGPGRLPMPPGEDWTEQDIEEVKSVNRLPVLVLAASRPDAPLTLTFRDAADAPAATVLVDRALFRAALDGDAWDVRATYLLRQPADAHLDVELPETPTAVRLRVLLDGKEVDPETLEQAGADGRPRHVVRLRLGGDLIRKPAVLELDYRLPARGALQATLAPPLLVGDPRQAPTRWQVTLPADHLVLAPEDDREARWAVGLRGWLPAPQVAVTNEELEQWFAGPDVPSWPAGTRARPSLVCWQDAGLPLTVSYVHESVWLGVCSVPLVLLGLLVFALARRSYAGSRGAAVCLWLCGLLLVPALAFAWVFRPTVLYAAAFGCEPGAVVLAVFVFIQAVMLERYRRRIVFLPNFRRARTGSSLVRGGVLHRPAGEPSTVDAPRVAGSSQQQI